jgi:hypothetical protein
MWLVHRLTEEEGWHITQENQKEPCPLLVFVRTGSAWKTKYWMSDETRICAKNHSEEIRDNYAMIQSGFTLGFHKSQYNMKKCPQCDH